MVSDTICMKCQTSFLGKIRKYLSQGIAFPTRLHIHPVKTQISLCISAVWSVSLQSTLLQAKDSVHLQTDSKEWSDWLIWVLARLTCNLVRSVVLWPISNLCLLKLLLCMFSVYLITFDPFMPWMRHSSMWNWKVHLLFKRGLYPNCLNPL